MARLRRACVALATHLDRLPGRRRRQPAAPRLITGTITPPAEPALIAAGRILPGRITTQSRTSAPIATGTISGGRIGDPE